MTTFTERKYICGIGFEGVAHQGKRESMCKR